MFNDHRLQDCRAGAGAGAAFDREAYHRAKGPDRTPMMRGGMTIQEETGNDEVAQ
jgi:hypothetical protein